MASDNDSKKKSVPDESPAKPASEPPSAGEPKEDKVAKTAAQTKSSLDAAMNKESTESRWNGAEKARERALKIKKMALLEIQDHVDGQDLSKGEKDKKTARLIGALPQDHIIAGDRAYENNDYETAINQYSQYVEKVTALINKFVKTSLSGAYEDLYRQTIDARYYLDGKEFESDAVKNPSLSDEDCQTVNDNLKQFYTPNIREKIAYGILKIIELHDKMAKSEETDAYDPSPFMHTLEETLCEKLYLRYLKNNELSPAYKDKDAIDPDHLHFYSTLNTELDMLGVDFFYVVDGEVFKDGQSRVIMVDITLDSLASKRRKNEAHDKVKYATILSFDELEKMSEFKPGEPKFLVAACNADNRNPLDRDNVKKILEYKLTMAAEEDEMINEKIIILAEKCAGQIVLELDNENDIRVLKKELAELRLTDPRGKKIRELEDEIAFLQKPANKPEFKMDQIIRMASAVAASARRRAGR